MELQAQSHPSTDSSITDHPSNELVLIVIWFETICKQHHCNIAELEPFSASIMPLIETCNQFHCDSCTIQRDLTSFDSTFELANKKTQQVLDEYQKELQSLTVQKERAETEERNASEALRILRTGPGTKTKTDKVNQIKEIFAVQKQKMTRVKQEWNDLKNTANQQRQSMVKKQKKTAEAIEQAEQSIQEAVQRLVVTKFHNDPGIYEKLLNFCFQKARSGVAQ
ncbi:MAG: hypothetical protein WCF19_08190 [Chlamydiales bacterium]